MADQLRNSRLTKLLSSFKTVFHLKTDDYLFPSPFKLCMKQLNGVGMMSLIRN